MTFSCFRLLIFLILPTTLFAQIDEVLVQPTLNLAVNKSTRWGFNTALQQRTVVVDNVEFLHVQAAQFVTYEMGFYSQLGAGVMYRELFDQKRPDEVRTTQQFVYSRKYNALKLAHRLRWNQRFRGDRLTHRWRYRISSALPLNGSKTDTNELYLTGSLETIFIAENGIKSGYDQRFSLGIGTQLTSNLKIQLVTQYRIEDFTMKAKRLLFFDLGMYYSLK